LFLCLNATSAQLSRIRFSAACLTAAGNFELPYVSDARDVVLFPSLWSDRIVRGFVLIRRGYKQFSLFHKLATFFHAIFSTAIASAIIPKPLRLAVNVVTPVP
jgi:hypothetical protein